MRRLLIGLLASAVCIGAASAETTPPPTKTPPVAAKPMPKKHPRVAAKTVTKTPKASTTLRSTASLECSKQADLKGLHGIKRIKFRHSCIRHMKKEHH